MHDAYRALRPVADHYDLLDDASFFLRLAANLIATDVAPLFIQHTTTCPSCGRAVVVDVSTSEEIAAGRITALHTSYDLCIPEEVADVVDLQDIINQSLTSFVDEYTCSICGEKAMPCHPLTIEHH